MYEKIIILRDNLQGIGGWSGLKSFVNIVGYRYIGDRLFFISKKRLGGRFYLRNYTCDITIANDILNKKSGEYNFLLKSDELKNAKVIIDAGANIGLFTRLCSNVNKTTKIISIELEQDNFDILKQNCNGNGQIELVNRGLWSSNGKLKIEKRSTGSVGFRAIEVDNNSDKYDVYAISVLELMKTYGVDTIDIFKIDIEGSEYYLFDDSCEEWIERVGMFIIELHDRIIEGCSERVIGILTKHNYKYTQIGDSYVFTKT